MILKNAFDYFAFLIFPVIIFITGMCGNILGFIVMSRKKLRHSGIISMNRYIFLTDISFLIQIIIVYQQISLSYDPTTSSRAFCKLFNYINYVCAPLSSNILAYISFERLMSIKNINNKMSLSKPLTQKLFLLCVLLFNLAYYCGILIYTDIVEFNLDDSSSRRLNTMNDYEIENVTINNNNDTKNDEFCDFIDKFSLDLYSYMDLFDNSVIPFILMFISSSLLSYAIFKSRNKMKLKANLTDRRKFTKDFKFTTCSICQNLAYAFLQIPVHVCIFVLPEYWKSTIYVFSLYLFYGSYSCNFYVMIFLNSIIRDEFYAFLGIKKIKKNAISITTFSKNALN